MTHGDYIKWGNDYDSIVTLVSGEYSTGGEWDEIPIYQLVGIEKEELKPLIIEFFNANVLEDTHAETTRLARAVHAYQQFQDILELSVEDDEPLVNRHYCYYESLVYLRESIVSWLDNNVLAAVTLLRPFLELAVLHLYWYQRSRQYGYGGFYSWLNGKTGKPPFAQQLKYVFDHLLSIDALSNAEVSRAKDAVRQSYKWGCTFNHTPTVAESLFPLSGGTGSKSIMALCYYPIVVNRLIRAMVRAYVLAYPMSVIPVERYKKWGFGGPVGIYFDPTNAGIVERCVGPTQMDLLRSRFAALPLVKGALDRHEQQDDLSASELEQEWLTFYNKYLGPSNSNPDNIAGRMALVKIVWRASGWKINYMENPPNVEDIDP